MSHIRCVCKTPNYNMIGRCLSCGGFHEGDDNPPPISNNNTPDIWRNKVTKQSFSRFPEKKQNHERDIWMDGVHYGAIEKQIEYATKLHEAQQENENLRRWKMEAVELLTKIHSYAHRHLEIKLGESTVEFTIARAKERDSLKERCDKMEAALNEIIKHGENVRSIYKTGKPLFYIKVAREALKEGESNTPAPSNDPEWIKQLSDDTPEVPDLTQRTNEEKKELVNALFQASGSQFMKLFYAIGLENMMESGMVNESTGDLFRLRFELMQKGTDGNTPAPVQGEKEAKRCPVFVPCTEDDPDCCGGYTSNDGRSLCYVKEVLVPLSSFNSPH
jgi:hypothetical protein